VSRHVVKEKIKGTRDVFVERDDGEVSVIWPCGEDREFTPDDLRTCLDFIEEFGDAYPGVFVQMEDSEGQQFVARLAGDDFLAGQQIDDTERFTWNTMRGALEDAADDIDEQLKADDGDGDGG